MNFVEFSKINNLSGKMVDAVKHFCDEILKINPESLTYSESASELTFMNVFTSRIDLVNREGLSVSVVSNSGKPSSGDIDRALGGKIAPGSILCTDKMNSYKKFAEKNSLDLHQSKAAEGRSDIYNIQKVNSYHSCLDRFMTPYNGVSTKIPAPLFNPEQHCQLCDGDFS